ncbi:MAG: GGDEF domain-containing protein [Deltaproteobacteria bacterium]|nr:GGDEF domain-containing protein [Deltaproteobacteria bacterium]MBW2394237.1 GGDEF domain-containing protein [Deltaproteobacteria bacterium]
MREPEAQSFPSGRWSTSSLAGRLLFIVLGGVVLSAVVVSGVAVHTTYRFLQREMAVAAPIHLDQAEQLLHDGIRLAHANLEARLKDPEGSAALEPSFRAVEPVSEAEAKDAEKPDRERLPHPRVLWQTGTPVPQLGVVVNHRGKDFVGWLSDPFRAEILGLPGAGPWRLRLLPDLPLPDSLGAPPGGWVDEPVPYRNRSGELVVGVTRGVAPIGGRLILEIPFGVAFEPVLSVLRRVAGANAALLFAFAFLARRVTRTAVGPIHALSEGARRISEGQLDVKILPIPTEDELALLTRTFNEMAEELQRQRSDIVQANERLQQQNDELQAANEVLGQLSITDGLTKLHNHRFFQDFLTREIKRTARSGEPLSILVIDIDDFKRLNDQLGHAAGDELLVRLAEILNDNVREADLIARYGGEEFVVLAPNTDKPGATLLAEKVRHGVASASFILDDTMRLTKMTISIGVNTFSGNRKDFFQGADEALYQAKAEGKNCVMVYEDPASSPRDPTAGRG